MIEFYIIYDNIEDWQEANRIITDDEKFDISTQMYADITQCKHPTEKLWKLPIQDVGLDTIIKLPVGKKYLQLPEDWEIKNEML